MKVIEDENITTDYFGNVGIIFKGAKDLREVYDWLFHHYNGYRFCIVLDCERDEWTDFGRDIRVDFLLDIATQEVKANHYYICRKNALGDFVEVK